MLLKRRFNFLSKRWALIAFAVCGAVLASTGLPTSPPPVVSLTNLTPPAEDATPLDPSFVTVITSAQQNYVQRYQPPSPALPLAYTCGTGDNFCATQQANWKAYVQSYDLGDAVTPSLLVNASSSGSSSAPATAAPGTAGQSTTAAPSGSSSNGSSGYNLGY